MRPTDFLMAAALTAVMSAPALAQTTTGGNWFAAGFVGANFATSRDTLAQDEDLGLGIFDPDLDLPGGASVDFGGSVGYMGEGDFGLEFLTAYAPNVGDPGVLFVDDQSVSSYMGNVIWAVPFGNEGKYRPFLSGGFGMIRVNADAFTVIGDPNSPDVSVSHNMFGGNIGGGIMAFAGNIGFRGDIRYYKASGDDNLLELSDTSTGDSLGTRYGDVVGAAAFSGLSFWRGNVGVAFRW